LISIKKRNNLHFSVFIGDFSRVERELREEITPEKTGCVKGSTCAVSTP
jgi:hypothetical protein